MKATVDIAPMDLIRKRNLNSEFKMTFQEEIKQGIPNKLPAIKEYDLKINHAPKRKEILNQNEKQLALKNK